MLRHFLETDPGITVVKAACNGKEAVNAARELRPHVVTMDIDMPGMSGIDALKHIMIECPTAVVLVSGLGRQAAQMTSTGLSLGAVDFILKYSPGSTIPHESLHREIVAKVRAAARVKVIRSIPSMETRFVELHQRAPVNFPEATYCGPGPRFRLSGTGSASILPEPITPGPLLERELCRLVVVGASTGGPLALKELLRALNEDFPFALVIVQHMPEGFTATLAAQFDRIFPFPVRQARDGEFLAPGTVLVAPGDRHLLIRPNGRVLINAAAKVNGCRPSIDATMQSAAQTFGRHLTGIILSGMGTDGTQGLAAIKRNGGRAYAQSEETCVIDTMPASVLRKGIVQQAGSPAEIGAWLV
jgi:two-component system chemotaxis response regulator CheB